MNVAPRGAGSPLRTAGLDASRAEFAFRGTTVRGSDPRATRMHVTLHRSRRLPGIALAIALAATSFPACGSSSSDSAPSSTPSPSPSPTPVSVPSPGELDASFGDGGIARTSFPDGALIFDVAIQPDGRIVAAGSIGGDLGVARYTADGRLDDGFSGGVVRIPFDGVFSGAKAVALQADGAIVLGGFVDDRALLLRLTPAGELDASFGDGGMVLDPIDAYGASATIDDVAVQSDGRLVATVSTGSQGVLVRRLVDGAPDPSFGTEGVVRYGATLDGCSLSRLAVRGDDALIAGGFCVGAFVEGRDGSLLLRYAPNADAPPRVLLPSGDATRSGSVNDITFEPDGALLIAVSGTLKLARFDATDRPYFFADGGPDQVGTGMAIAGIAVDAAGRIVTAGTFRPPGRVPNDVLVIARFAPDGSLDATFGNRDGLSASNVHDVGAAVGVALQPDGKIVVAASHRSSGARPIETPGFTLLRFGS